MYEVAGSRRTSCGSLPPSWKATCVVDVPKSIPIRRSGLAATLWFCRRLRFRGDVLFIAPARG